MPQSGKETTHAQSKAGLPPGTPVFVGSRRLETPLFSKINYNETEYHEIEDTVLAECLNAHDSSFITWINVEGIHDVESIKAVVKSFDIHPLTVEDIVNTMQRPKMEDYGHYIFVVLKMISYKPQAHDIEVEQVSIIYGENFVLTFQEGLEGDVFEPIREQIRTAKGRLRKMGSDYLVYALMDTVVDQYFLVLEELGNRIETIEDRLVENPTPAMVKEIHRLKRSMVYLRKSVWPLREEISKLEKLDSPLVQQSTRVFLRDLYDHTIQVIDTVETYRDILAGMHDTYLSSISNRMNEVMKVLTIIATIFIPLTFIAGIYGMNFDNMPELHWRWGYFIVLGFMALVAGVMLWFFRKKKWL